MKVSPDLIQVWQADPQAQVAVIVHVEGDPAQYVEAVKEHGISVVRTFRLTNTVAGRGPAGRVLELLQAPWVTKVEPDRRITTMG